MIANDLELLRQFTRDGSQAAFTALVQRHANLVYSAALRQVRLPQLAEDVTQSVFIDLARNAASLLGARPEAILTAWLYQVARRTAIDVIRKESRRQLREQIASEINATEMNATEPGWEHTEPLLDEAMSVLDEVDRVAILLRYFENQPFREVGRRLGVSDDAAQKRVGRAMEQLRTFFNTRGVAVSAGGLVVLITSNAVQAAPVGLVATISAAALGGAALSTSTLTTITKSIAMTTFQKILVTTSVVVTAGAIAIAINQARQNAKLREEIQAAQHQQELLARVAARRVVETNLNGDGLKGLESENRKLAKSLNSAVAKISRLEATRQEAEREAQMYKELADQANPTNKYPTHRHLASGIGNLIARQINLQILRDREDLTPEQKKEAVDEAKSTMLSELGQVLQATEILGKRDQSKVGVADAGTCLLYGALGLSEQQYQQTYGILQKYHDEAQQQGLLEKNLSSEAIAALGQLNVNANAEINGILSASQSTLFNNLHTGGLSYSFVGTGQDLNFSIKND